MTFLPYIVILRPANLFMTAIAVALGFWLGQSNRSLITLLLLIIASMAASGFGNVINDIRDLKTDLISHPDRPLPKKQISIKSAWYYAILLFTTSILCAFSGSFVHGWATLIPLLLLTLYAFFLKATPLIGNIIVSILVAYALLFGALGTPLFSYLLLPAFLAFTLNMSREIIKAVHDESGDTVAGYRTTAILSPNTLRWILILLGCSYLIVAPLPYFFNQFHLPYLLIVVVIIPFHVFWNTLLFSSQWKSQTERIALFIKIEMFVGLVALAVDRLIN